MDDRFEKRADALEDKYFHQKDVEAIEQLRAKMKVSAEAKAAGTSSMECPRCDGVLKENEFEKVSLNSCVKCGGVWLDSGELETLLKPESAGWLHRLWSAVTE
jgi:hypothetical protein